MILGLIGFGCCIFSFLYIANSIISHKYPYIDKITKHKKNSNNIHINSSIPNISNISNISNMCNFSNIIAIQLSFSWTIFIFSQPIFLPSSIHFVNSCPSNFKTETFYHWYNNKIKWIERDNIKWEKGLIFRKVKLEKIKKNVRKKVK